LYFHETLSKKVSPPSFPLSPSLTSFPRLPNLPHLELAAHRRWECVSFYFFRGPFFFSAFAIFKGSISLLPEENVVSSMPATNASYSRGPYALLSSFTLPFFRLTAVTSREDSSARLCPPSICRLIVSRWLSLYTDQPFFGVANPLLDVGSFQVRSPRLSPPS